MAETLPSSMEVISINDHSFESEEPKIPHERQIMDAVIALWKEDPSTESLGVPKLHSLVKGRNPNWALSEKRTKTVLKKFGMMPNSVSEQFTYAKYITSLETPDIELPAKIRIVMTAKRGKGLFARKNIQQGEIIWSEKPLFFVPPIANVNLMKSGRACAYCSKLLGHAGDTGIILKGLDCNVCPEMWCSTSCKKENFHLHGLLKHSIYNPNPSRSSMKAINSAAFLDLQNYCLNEQWNALYAITLIYASVIDDKSGVKREQFAAMARVSQDVRYKALNSAASAFDNLQGGALFVQEQQEELWKKGFEYFRSVFPKSSQNEELDYESFLYLLGTYNINNLDSSVYLIQSHLNHNCDPNIKVEISGSNRAEGIKVFAKRDIKAGEELTTTYVNPAHTVQQRQRELRVNWGFVCGCDKCKDDLKNQHRRKSSSSVKDKTSIQNMLKNAKKEMGNNEIELGIPVDYNGERRKSVRFDEKVTKVTVDK